MGMDHVEAPVFEPEMEEIANLETDRDVGAGHRRCLLDHRCRGVDPNHPPWRHAASQITGDRPGPATDVEEIHPRAQVPKQIGGRVLRGPPPMGAEHAVVVSVGIRNVCHRSSMSAYIPRSKQLSCKLAIRFPNVSIRVAAHLCCHLPFRVGQWRSIAAKSVPTCGKPAVGRPRTSDRPSAVHPDATWGGADPPGPGASRPGGRVLGSLGRCAGRTRWRASRRRTSHPLRLFG